ncbi:hypothetical protein QTG54_011507 [Skeletonema marinoi]|uniref:Uncharacterized protein n=1 Tax=Skeletonema marinoi TaxID=267567 RepID=A0AAD8Y2Q5_9STRA|nr:hypothetical protein QTG54_011507 [Skeletonema marinoi]
MKTKLFILVAMTTPTVGQHRHLLQLQHWWLAMRANRRLVLLLQSSLLLLFLLSSTSSLHHHHISALTTHHSHHHYIPTTPSPTSLTAHNRANTQTDWAQYSLRQTYKKAGGILYKQSVLTPAEFTAVQMAIEQLNLKLTEEKESSFATNRIGAVIEKESDVYKILSCDEGSLCRLVNGLAHDDDDDDGSNEKEEDLGKMILSPDIPIEIRIYEKAKAGMEWHVDDVIYQNTKQIEVVFTLENTSDCCTMWRPHDQPILAAISTTTTSQQDDSITSGRKQENINNFRVESVQTTPNSAILIKAGSVEHKVSSLSYGRRVILKMAFVREGALMSDEMRNHVSHHNGSGSVGKRKRRKKKR